MKTLIELREQQANILTTARTEMNQIDDDTTEARAAEIETAFDAAMEDYDKLGKTIERQERLEALESAGDPRAPQGENREAQAEDTPEYREVFDHAMREGVDDLDAEERVVFESRALTTGTDASGGYTVPVEYAPGIDVAMAAWGPMWDANIVTELNTTNGREIEWPTVSDITKSGRIKAESGSVDDDGTDDVVFGQKLLNAYVYDTGMVKVPMELLSDSAYDIEGLIHNLFGERLGRLANTTLTTGTGSSQPNGIVTASTLGKTAAAVAAVTADEVIDLVHSVDPAYRASPKCRFMFNDTTLSQLRKLKDGQANYLWQMGDVRAGEPAQILGHQYSVNQAMADQAAAAKPIIFGDFSKYYVRKVLGFQVLTLRERYAEKFQIGMVGFKRFDGELIDATAINHLINAAA